MKFIPEYEGLYSITKDGEVFSHKSNKYLKPQKRNRNKKYLSVCLFKNGNGPTGKHFMIHRLVAKTYMTKPADDMTQINHIDGDPTNNCINNLEWTNNSGNQKHAFKLGLQDNTGVKHPVTKFTEDDIINIKLLLKEGVSHSKIAKKYNVHKSTITLINRGKTWTHIKI